MRAVRLGNVLGTQGSVVPTFLQQISEGGPVTVTHPLVDRYFLSLDDAVELVLLATSLDGKGGIFIPNPGESVRILDLAQRLIKEAGFEPEIEIPIVITGLRPGDKMTEEFVSDLESVDWADNARLHLIKTPQPSPEEFDSSIAALKDNVARRNLGGVLEQLCRIVPEYRPSEMVLESLKEQQSISS
jgi:FlaA1/EpsC-like NDP-sugar epimerase